MHLYASQAPVVLLSLVSFFLVVLHRCHLGHALVIIVSSCKKK